MNFQIHVYAWRVSENHFRSLHAWFVSERKYFDMAAEMSVCVS